MMFSRKLLLLFVFIVVVAGCRQQPEAPPATIAPPPDAAETEPTAVPTSTPMPPTATATALPPTATIPPTETPVPPTATAPPPTAIPEVPLALIEPEAEAVLDVGSEVPVRGEATPGGEPLTISLEAAGVTLVENTLPLDGSTTGWETVLVVPESVTGRALLRISRPDSDPVEIPVLLRRPATSATAISLAHPDVETVAVASQVLFFQGRVQQPIEGELTIAVLYEDCQTVGARQTFDVGQGGQWWGYVIIPETVFGPGCAVAYTGEFEEEGWRAAATPLTILEATDPDARGVFVGNLPLQEVAPGETVTVFGRAYRTDRVGVNLIVEDEIVASGNAPVDRWGYWEVDLTLPATAVPGSDGFFFAAATYGDESLTGRGTFLVEASSEETDE